MYVLQISKGFCGQFGPYAYGCHEILAGSMNMSVCIPWEKGVRGGQCHTLTNDYCMI